MSNLTRKKMLLNQTNYFKKLPQKKKKRIFSKGNYQKKRIITFFILLLQRLFQMHPPEALPLPSQKARATSRRRSPHVRSHLPRGPHVPHVRHRPLRSSATAACHRRRPTHIPVPPPLHRLAFSGGRRFCKCLGVRRSGNRTIRKRRGRAVSGGGPG